MKKNAITLFFLFLLVLSCHKDQETSPIETWKKEIISTEENFALMVKNEGLHAAFVAFADENAVIMRNDSLIKGKKAIDHFYKGINTKALSWTADEVIVSKSGDLGYTFGTYQFTHTDSIGNAKVDTGIFHSIWKQQPDGTWKYVWD